MKQETTNDDRPEVKLTAQRTSEGARRPYDSPKLTSYGSLPELTEGVGNVGKDAIIGSRNKA
jgi:hypothetical protein